MQICTKKISCPISRQRLKNSYYLIKFYKPGSASLCLIILVTKLLVKKGSRINSETKSFSSSRKVSNDTAEIEERDKRRKIKDNVPKSERDCKKIKSWINNIKTIVSVN